jgi:hypothetical protein
MSAPPSTSKAAGAAAKRAEKRRLEDAPEQGLEGTFPGTDPVHVTRPVPSKGASQLKQVG